MDQFYKKRFMVWFGRLVHTSRAYLIVTIVTFLFRITIDFPAIILRQFIHQVSERLINSLYSYTATSYQPIKLQAAYKCDKIHFFYGNDVYQISWKTLLSLWE